MNKMSSFETAKFRDYEILAFLGESEFFSIPCFSFTCQPRGSEKTVLMKIAMKKSDRIGPELEEVIPFVKRIVQDVPTHPNVVKCLAMKWDEIDFNKLPGLQNVRYRDPQSERAGMRSIVFFVFEYFPKNLVDVRREIKRKLTQNEFLRIAQDLLRGIYHLRKHKIVHKCLSNPKHIFVDSSGKRLTVKIGGFEKAMDASRVDGFRVYIPRDLLEYFEFGDAGQFPEVLSFFGDAELRFSGIDAYSVALLLLHLAKTDWKTFGEDVGVAVPANLLNKDPKFSRASFKVPPTPNTLDLVSKFLQGNFEAQKRPMSSAHLRHNNYVVVFGREEKPSVIELQPTNSSNESVVDNKVAFVVNEEEDVSAPLSQAFYVKVVLSILEIRVSFMFYTVEEEEEEEDNRTKNTKGRAFSKKKSSFSTSAPPPAPPITTSLDVKNDFYPYAWKIQEGKGKGGDPLDLAEEGEDFDSKYGHLVHRMKRAVNQICLSALHVEATLETLYDILDSPSIASNRNNVLLNKLLRKLFCMIIDVASLNVPHLEVKQYAFVYAHIAIQVSSRYYYCNFGSSADSNSNSSGSNSALFYRCFLGTLFEKCIYTAPWYHNFVVDDSFSDDKFREILGFHMEWKRIRRRNKYGKVNFTDIAQNVESRDSFFKRMEALVSLYAAFCVLLQPQAQGIGLAWEWVARFIKAPPTSISPNILAAFLGTAGEALLQLYRPQFFELVKYLKYFTLPAMKTTLERRNVDMSALARIEMFCDSMLSLSKKSSAEQMAQQKAISYKSIMEALAMKVERSDECVTGEISGNIDDALPVKSIWNKRFIQTKYGDEERLEELTDFTDISNPWGGGTNHPSEFTEWGTNS